MAFKLALSPTFWATVRTELPAPDSDQPVVVAIKVQYKRLSLTELQDLVERIQSQQLDDDRKIAREVVVGWRDVVGEDDKPLEFTSHNFDQLLDLGFAGPICKKFFGSQAKAKEKN